MAVGHDHGSVEIERVEGGGLLFALQRLGRVHGQAERVGEFVHRRLALVLAAARCFGSTRIDRSHVMAGLNQRSQSGHGEFRGAEKRDLHCRIL